jgi:hypothetical protein
MMLKLKVAANSRGLALAPATAAKRRIKPPALKLLPRRTYTKGLLLSGGFHAVAIAALIWLPALFSSPVIVNDYREKAAVAAALGPLILPLLPKLSASDSGSLGSAAPAPQMRSSVAVNPVPASRDYAGPQEIISDFPNAVNHVQTIRRPDLVAPPDLKFPLRLQSMVILPATAAPRLAARPREQPRRPPITRAEVEIPIPEATVTLPRLVTVPPQVPVAAAEPAPPKAAEVPAPSAMSTAVAEIQITPRKAVIVVNAVSAAPDPALQIPDAQLTGNFVVGPSLGTTAPGKSPAGGNGRSAETGPPKNTARASQPDKGSNGGTETATGASGGHSAITGSGDNAEPGADITSGGGAGSRSGALARGNGNSGASGRGMGSSNTGGLSISGGSPGRSVATVSRSLPMNRSYGITIISGGSSGGAGRDMGVFDRSETVFSVAIPMSDAGGGADWPMQYSLMNHAQSGSGMVVPPFAQKKVAATTTRAQLAGEQGPVFISGTIDETGKLQSLRTTRVLDARAQPAIHALQQWEFLPAQLDGRPVASKVLIGVTVTAEE